MAGASPGEALWPRFPGCLARRRKRWPSVGSHPSGTHPARESGFGRRPRCSRRLDRPRPSRGSQPGDVALAAFAILVLLPAAVAAQATLTQLTPSLSVRYPGRNAGPTPPITQPDVWGSALSEVTKQNRGPYVKENTMAIDQVDRTVVTQEPTGTAGQQTVRTDRRHTATSGPGAPEIEPPHHRSGLRAHPDRHRSAHRPAPARRPRVQRPRVRASSTSANCSWRRSKGSSGRTP